MHLLLVADKIRELDLKCTCGTIASRLVRCRKCKAVIARCGSHGDRMDHEAQTHCV